MKDKDIAGNALLKDLLSENEIKVIKKAYSEIARQQIDNNTLESMKFRKQCKDLLKESLMKLEALKIGDALEELKQFDYCLPDSLWKKILSAGYDNRCSAKPEPAKSVQENAKDTIRTEDLVRVELKPGDFDYEKWNGFQSKVSMIMLDMGWDEPQYKLEGCPGIGWNSKELKTITKEA